MRWLFLILPLFLNAQIMKKDIAPICLMAASGALDGFAETLKFHYDRVDGLNDDFWNPAISWKNKYKHGNPAEGEAFTGSTTVFVGVTDGYHLTRTLRNCCMITGITLKIGDKQKWYYYVLEAVIL